MFLCGFLEACLLLLAGEMAGHRPVGASDFASLCSGVLCCMAKLQELLANAADIYFADIKVCSAFELYIAALSKRRECKDKVINKEGVLCVVHARCLYWGNVVDLPTYSTVKCVCVQAVKGITIAHTALCPLTVSSTSLSWLVAGITVMACCGHHCHLRPIKWG